MLLFARVFLIVSLLLVFVAAPASAAWNDETNSWDLASTEVALYDSYDGKGKPWLVLQRSQKQSDLRTLSTTAGGNWNDRVSCIHVGENASITVYKHINFGGSSKTFGPGLHSLLNTEWDNAISSFKKN